MQLSYADKLLTDIQQEFRDRYKNILEVKRRLFLSAGQDFFGEFDSKFQKILQSVQKAALNAPKVQMKGFQVGSGTFLFAKRTRMS